MKVSILIVTHAKDFGWLKWCLKSIEKFASGFHDVTVAVPSDTPASLWVPLRSAWKSEIPLNLYGFEDWPGKGFVRHMDRIIHADQICEEADFILHTDSDCIFIEPVKPEDYFVDGKPVLIGAPYDWVVRKFNNPHHLRWKEAVERALGGKSEQEFMRRHPAVHPLYLYPIVRACIKYHTGKPASDYIRTTQNTFPHQFCEFCTLGEVAWRQFRNDYHWLRQDRDPWPTDKLLQMWGHGAMDQPQNVWQGGDLHVMIPNEVFNRLLV